MLIGLTFDMKPAGDPGGGRGGARAGPRWVPDDLDEEYDSPETVEALAAALRENGHDVVMLGDGVAALRRLLDGERPDLVFNIAEGEGIGRSREARIPAVLEMLGIPCTGSDPLTLALTLDKVRTKQIVAAHGVSTPDFVVLTDDHPGSLEDALARLGLPLIAKPAWEGSSKGIREDCLIRRAEDFPDLVRRLMSGYDQPVLVEAFIDGRELTVGVIGNDPVEVLGIMEIRPRRPGPFVYGLEVKRNWRELAEYLSPAPLTRDEEERVREAALSAWGAVGGRDVGRLDFRLRDGVPWFLETNPLPGLSPVSGDLVLLARGIGLDHAGLVHRILTSALDRIAARRRRASHAHRHPLQRTLAPGA